MHVPVVVYADSEAILRPISICRKKTEKYQEHLPCGFGFHFVSPFVEFDPVLIKAGND